MKPALVLVALAGCIKPPGLTLCEDGRACAPGLACDEAHRSCVHPDQLTACEGSPDLAACTTSLFDGACAGGVCVEPGCGNYLVESDEQCDDGNTLSFDGCSATCDSTEVCGNGFVDIDEVCDDGNLVSHDGCSSQCTPETFGWRAYPINAKGGGRSRSAFMPTRGRLVFAPGWMTWEWDGAAWTIPTIRSPYRGWNVLAYDSDRDRIVASGYYGSAEYDGLSWTVLTISGTAPTLPTLAVYDRARKKTLVLSNGAATYLDLTTSSWGAAMALPFSLTGASIAYDENRNRVVVLTPSMTWEWDGANWTSSTDVPYAAGDVALTYDPSRRKVVGLGGHRTSPSTDSTDVLEWSGTAWTSTGLTIPARSNATAWYSTATSSLWVFGGATASGPSDQVFQLSASGAIDRTPVHPGAQGQIVSPDPTGDGLDLLEGTGAVWNWDGAWHARPDAGPIPVQGEAFAYDPVRGGILAMNPLTPETWLFKQGAWQQLAVTGTPSASPLTFDVAHRRMVTMSYLGLWGLGSTDSAWQVIGPGISASCLAYDALTKAMVGYIDGMSGGVIDFVDPDWVLSLSPGSNYRMVESPATKSVVLVPGLNNTDLWERRGQVWGPLGTAPMPSIYGTRPHALSRGRIAYLGDDILANALIILQWTSTTPDESCAVGEDLDEDGAAGCADPDCWWKCDRTCPYQTSCN